MEPLKWTDSPRPTPRPADLTRSPRSFPPLASLRRLALAAAFALPLFPFLVPPAGAAKLVLKNGSVIEGLIVEDVPDESITIRSDGTTLRFAYNQIKTLDRESTHAVEEQMGDQLAKQGKIEEALEHYVNAKENNQGSAEIDKKIKQMRDEIEEKELAQYSDQIQEAQADIDEGRLAEAEHSLRELNDTVKLESVKRRSVQMLARLHYKKAQRAMDVVDYATAESELLIAIELYPEFADAHVELGDLYNSRQLGKSQALKEYIRGLELGAGTLPRKEEDRICWNIARIAQETENLDLALEYYKRVYDSNPRYDSRLIDNMAEAFLKRGNELADSETTKSIALMKEGLVYQPGDTELRYRLIQLLVGGNQRTEALDELKSLFAIDNQFPNSHYLAARCLLGEGRVLEARTELQAEIRVDPKHLEALRELGDMAYHSGSFDDAESCYLRVIELDPFRVEALLGMAKVMRRRDNRLGARQYVERVLESHPDNREANLEMGSILKEEKNYQEARKFFDKVVSGLQKQETPLGDNEKQLLADALNRRGEIYLLLDQPRTARNDFEEALKYEPDYGLTFYNIGQSYLKEAASDEATLLKAETNMIRSRELDPKNTQFAQGLGIFYQQYMSQRDIPDARKKGYLEKAVKNYQDYLKLGGADVDNVTKWIEESGGTVKKD